MLASYINETAEYPCTQDWRRSGNDCAHKADVNVG